jgi:hypothetical protein
LLAWVALVLLAALFGLTVFVFLCYLAVRFLYLILSGGDSER